MPARARTSKTKPDMFVVVKVRPDYEILNKFTRTHKRVPPFSR